MTSIYLELRPNSLRRPFRAFRNLALEPRACALGCPTPSGSLVSRQKLATFRCKNEARGPHFPFI